MKKEFYLNVFLFPVLSQFFKQASYGKPVFQLIKSFTFNNDIFGVNRPASVELVPVKSNSFSKVYSPLPTVSLAPI